MNVKSAFDQFFAQGITKGGAILSEPKSADTLRNSKIPMEVKGVGTFPVILVKLATPLLQLK